MDRDAQRRVEELFYEALDRPAEEREAFVTRRAGADATLRDAVMKLLEHHASAQNVFSTAPEGDGGLPDTIGPYRILDILGEGGMGTVYLARQETPISRDVAVKVIRAGRDTSQVLARFQVEQQALAMLDHPSIARVLDAGSTAEGRPYFVMEYAPGVPITRYCDENRMTFRERIELFLKVCHAIQHAHQKGIIHRDIKPGNVIVVEQDGVAMPKVIDFGVAKAIDRDALPAVTFSGAGQLIGTLEYMSPEQAALGDVDTRTDVYALGLLLYELLVGVLPFEPSELQERGLDEMIRVIRDSDPPRPSTRVSTLGETAAHAADRRRTEPGSLVRQLRGDLDWIVMKALEKDRERRYPSASDFAADISRYLTNQPVVARPPSAVYRIRKFSRRHRVGVSAAAVVVMALVTVAVVTAVQSNRVARERDRAEHQGRISREVADYLGGMFHQSATAYGFADSVKLMDAMGLGLRNLDDAGLMPESEIEVLRVLGQAYASMTTLDAAHPVIERLVRTTLSHYGENHVETARSRMLLLSFFKQRNRSQEAIELGNRILPVLERDLGPDAPETQQCMWYLAGAHLDAGHYDASLEYYQRLSTAYRRTLGGDHPRLGMLYNEMSNAFLVAGRLGEAEDAANESLRILSNKYGARSAMTIVSLQTLCSILEQGERYDEALECADKLERITEATYGENHPEARTLQARRGWILLRKHEYEEARDAFQGALVVPANVQDYHLADPMLGLGVAQRELGNIADARRNIERSLEIREASYQPPHPAIIKALGVLGDSERGWGNLDRADSLLGTALAMAIELTPTDSLAVAETEVLLGDCLLAQERFTEAEVKLVQAERTLNRIHRDGSRLSRRARRSLVSLYEARDQPDKADRYRSDY